MLGMERVGRHLGDVMPEGDASGHAGGQISMSVLGTSVAMGPPGGSGVYCRVTFSSPFSQPTGIGSESSPWNWRCWS